MTAILSCPLKTRDLHRGKVLISQRFGELSRTSAQYAGHTGIDIVTKRKNVELLAAHEGEATKIPGGVIITTEEIDIRGLRARLEILYYHLSEVYEGKVQRGDVIGRSGCYNTDQEHTHLSVTPYWLDGECYKADTQNGFDGRVDPLLYFNCEFEDVRKANPYKWLVVIALVSLLQVVSLVVNSKLILVLTNE